MADYEKDYEYYKNNLSVNDDLENISKDIKKEREYFNKHKDIQGAEQRLKELEAKEKVVNELRSKESKEPKYEIVNDFSIDAIKDNFTPPGAKSQKDEDKSDLLKAAEKVIKTSKPVEVNEYLTLEPREPKVEDVDTSAIDEKDSGKSEEDDLDLYMKDLDDYMSKNKKGRDDIPVATRR